MIDKIVDVSVFISILAAIISAVAAVFALRVQRGLARLQSKEGMLPPSPESEEAAVVVGLHDEADEGDEGDENGR